MYVCKASRELYLADAEFKVGLGIGCRVDDLDFLFVGFGLRVSGVDFRAVITQPSSRGDSKTLTFRSLGLPRTSSQ